MIVDFHAYLGRWPAHPLPIKNASDLVRRMDRTGVGVSFVSSVEGVLALDWQMTNRQLTRSVERYKDRLLPVGTVNPTQAGWAHTVRESIRRLRLAGFRLHPAYHGYDLCAPEVAALADLLAEERLPLFIAAFIEDERFSHPALRVPSIPIDRMMELIRRAPHTLIVLNNLTPDEVVRLLQAPDLPLDNVLMDVAALDKPFDGLSQVRGYGGSRRLVYGSQVPFLYPEATLALVQASGLADEEVDAILEGNWSRHPVLEKLITRRTS